METSTATRFTASDVNPTADLVTAGRVRILATVMVLAALPGVVLMLFWEGPDDADHLYTFAELSPDRDLWWGILVSFGLLLAISAPLQALLTMLLVRERGSSFATVGGLLLWFGAVTQAVGLAGWATAYYFPTDPEVGEAAGKAVFDAANGDEFHLYGLVPIGMALMVIGTVCQAVGMFRAKTVPVWVPVVALSVILIFLVPGFGAVSLISSLPMLTATVAIGVFAVRSVRSA